MESSVFGNRTPGDCRQHARHVIIYDGTSATVPTLDRKTIIFGGGLSSEPSLGLGFTGAAITGDPFKLEYESIKDGGAGTRIRASLDSLKRKERLSCKNKLCGASGEQLYLQITMIGTCEFPTTNWEWNEPILVGFECGCLETCCQRLNKVAREINYRATNYGYPVTATVINIGTDYFLDIEAVELGRDFRITVNQGFNDAKTIVPYNKQQLTAYQVAYWFPNKVIPLLANNPTKKMTAMEIYYWKKVPVSGAAAAATSNENSDTYHYETVSEMVTVLFDTATTQSNTAFTALKTILTGTTEYNKKLASAVATDQVYYAYQVVRTDAGDPAALTDARADYPTNYVSLERAGRQGGVSYYTLITTSATPPTADGSDVVTQGAFQSSDLPVVADGCPVPENSVCLGC